MTLEWIEKAARDAVAANKAGNNFAVSQAMMAVAARVERETREADALRLDDLSQNRRARKTPEDKRTITMNADLLREDQARVLEVSAAAIRSLPPTHKEPS